MYEENAMRLLMVLGLGLGCTAATWAQTAPAPAPAAAATPATAAPVPGAPSVRLGLWENSAVTKLPPQLAEMKKKYSTTTTGDDGSTVAAKTQTCLTADTWQKMLNLTSTPTMGCSAAKTVPTEKGIFSRMTCAAGKAVTMEVQATTTVDSTEKAHSHVHTTTTYAAFGPIAGGTMVADTEVLSHFVSDDCGAVGPGKVVSVK